MKAVIFDIDGTLVDSVDFHAQAWQEAFAEFGKKIKYELVREQIGKGGDEILKTFLSKTEIEEFGEKLKEFRSNHFKTNYINRVMPFPKVRKLFECVKASGKRIAIGSSAHKEEVDHYLNLANVIDLVDVKTSSDDVDRAKPHADIFALVLDRLDLSADEAIVVGDSPYDSIAAKKLKLKTIGFLCGGFEQQKLIDAGIIETYHDPADLLKNYDASAIQSVN